MIYMHTEKAIGRGHPRDRVFMVVDIVNGEVLAWKCKITPQGIEHPAFKDNLPVTIEGCITGCMSRGSGYCTPTALFKADSLYKKVTVDDLVNFS
jgi:hypothetical protein